MNAVDEYLQWNSGKERKLRFVSNKDGAADAVVKRVDKTLRGVYEQLRFLRCPNLPVICAIEEKEDCLEVAEQYIDGRSLQYVLDEQGAQDDVFVQRLARQMAETLKLLHGLRPPVIHRDIKPQNIMQHGDDFILIDFDAARWFDKSARKDTAAIGTQGYAAPEQYGFAQTDARSDIFSLGVTLFEMRMGTPYRKGAVCDGRIKKVVAKCTQFDADKRYQSAEELLSAIRRAEKARPWKKTMWYAATLIAAFAAFVLVGADRQSKNELLLGAMQAERLPSVSQPLATPYGSTPPVISAEVAGLQAAVLPSPSQEICTCKLISMAKAGDEGAIFTPVEIGIDEARMGTSQICARLPVDSSECTASVHEKQKVTYQLSKASAALGATTDAYGIVTVKKPGTYTVFYTAELNGETCNGYYRFHAHDEITSETEPISHVRGCTCKLIEPVDIRDSSSTLLPGILALKDNQPMSTEVYVRYAIDSTGCKAKVHSDQVATYELEPESIGMGATLDDNIITVDTPGLYRVRCTIKFNGVDYSAAFGFKVNEG